LRPPLLTSLLVYRLFWAGSLSIGSPWQAQWPDPRSYGDDVLTIYGVVVLTFMMVMYALERRDRRLILAFALGCVLSSSYGFLSGTWPFGVVEAVWSVVALHRFARRVPTRPT
jgi:hypothetical protein